MKKRKRRGLPRLTALQFLVVGLLLGETKTAKQVRQKLGERGVRLARPSLYRAISRLERAKWLEGTLRRSVIEGQVRREREYRVTVKGLIAWRRTRRFYLEIRPPGAMLKPDDDSRQVAEERLIELAEKMDQRRKDARFRADLERGLIQVVKGYVHASKEEWQAAVERVMRGTER